MASVDQQKTGDLSTMPPPPALVRTFVRYTLSFGVSVVVGLAPYLGRYRVPFFTPLLDLIPEVIQDATITLSAAIMGVVAAVVQYYGSEQLTRTWLKNTFERTLKFGLATFVVLAVVHTFTVVTVPTPEAGESLKCLVGFKRPHRAPCPAEISDEECIQRITVSPAAIRSFWGDTQLRLAELALTFSYVAFTSSFGMLVGLLVIKNSIYRINRQARAG